MMTSSPRLIYWQPATLAVMQAIPTWRQKGLAVCYTIDAGPNVHALCKAGDQAQVEARLRQIAGVQEVLVAYPGSPARLLS
jgi:diphosphomevalonate decarboxylase